MPWAGTATRGAFQRDTKREEVLLAACRKCVELRQPLPSLRWLAAKLNVTGTVIQRALRRLAASRRVVFVVRKRRRWVERVA